MQNKSIFVAPQVVFNIIIFFIFLIFAVLYTIISFGMFAPFAFAFGGLSLSI